MRRRLLRARGGEGGGRGEQGCLWACPVSILSDIVETLTLRVVPCPMPPVSSPKPFSPTPGTGRTDLRCALRSDRWGARSPHSSCLQAGLAPVRAVVCDLLIILFSSLFSAVLLRLPFPVPVVEMDPVLGWVSGTGGGARALGSPCSAG